MFHSHPMYARWDARRFRQQSRSGSTNAEMVNDLMRLKNHDYVLVAWQWNHEDHNAMSDWTILRIITVPSQRRSDQWTGTVCKPLRVVPIDVGELVPFCWHHILSYYSSLSPFQDLQDIESMDWNDLPPAKLALPPPPPKPKRKRSP